MNPKININNLGDVYDYLDKNIKTEKQNRNDRGEVFTPLAVVNEMLDKLPDDVWSNKDLTWLDPAVGIGNFMVVIYERLMVGLMNVIPNRKKRQKHILESMLFMVEINANSIQILKNIFCARQFNLNIFEGSFIDTKEDVNVFPIPNQMFNIIVGNPPYNQGGISTCNKMQSSKLPKITLWNFFVEKSFNCLIKNGLLLFITPLSWLKETNKSHHIILEKQILYLELWDSGYSKITIDASISLSIFLVKNLLNSWKHETNVFVKFNRHKNRFLSGNFSAFLDTRFNIPTGFIKQITKMSAFIFDNNCPLMKIDAMGTNEYKTKRLLNKKDGLIEMTLTEMLNLSAEENYAIDTYLNKGTYLLNKLSSPAKHANVRKVILSNKSLLEGVFLDEGKFSIGSSRPNLYYAGDNLELIFKILNFKLMKILAISTKYRMNFIDSDIGRNIPDLRVLGYTDIEEDEFYNLMGLTENEKEEIYNAVLI